LLQVSKLHSGYGPLTVLRDVSLSVDAGQIVALIGANGAGKTTLLRTISGVLSITAGTITLGDDELTRHSVHEIVRMGVAHVPEGRQVFGGLTVRDNLELGAIAWTESAIARSGELERAMELFPRLRERSSQLAGTLSGGEQQMLAIGRALMARPRLLLLDEPSLGLAPMVVTTIFETILQLKNNDLAILLVEQNARAALAMADHAYVLETGSVVMSGPGPDLLHNKRVQEIYLGGTAASA
jgi:branched-chain amino acid transport system ATP-binding protein